MGRTLKRVALDFNWPLKKVWDGFVNPHHQPCPEAGTTCFNGENAASKYLSHISSMLTLIGDDARRGSTHPYCETLPYYGEHPDWSIQPLEVRQKMVDLIGKLTGKNPVDGLGFGGSDYKIFHKLLEVAGIRNKDDEKAGSKWGYCQVCNGENIDPAVKAQYDSWVEQEPPKGEGFQLWETTSEGSPVSPVFPTLDALCAWCEKNATTFADNKTSAENWKKMLGDGFVHHQEGNMVFI